MAVKSKSSLLRSSVIALTVGVLSLPAMAQAAPEDRGNWRQRVAREDSPRAERAEPAPPEQQAERHWSPPVQTQGAVNAAPQSRWNSDEDRRGGEDGRRARDDTWRSQDRELEAWQSRTAAPRRDAAPAVTRTAIDWRSRVQRSDYDRTGERNYRRKRDWNSHWDRSRHENRSGWNNQWTRGSNYSHWNTRWRSDNRYDWHGWRSRYPSRFQVGVYYSPYRNYSYRRLSIGYFLDSLFFDQDYWIANPSYYRLPEAYGPYRWVRYYDDAVMVDIYSGEIVDIVYNFFW